MSASNLHSFDTTHSIVKSEFDAHLLQGLRPPPLNYSLRDRKKSIVIIWTIIILDACILPIVLFYALWFTKVSHLTVISILSSVFGLSTLYHFANRMYYLCKKDSTCRPIGSKRRWLDAFEIGFALSIIVVTVQTIPAVDMDDPLVPLFAMLTSTTLFTTGFTLVCSFIFYNFRMRLPFRLSSLPAGHIAHPAVFTIIEDIIAVDGGGGVQYREELVARYDASPLFRHMLNRLDAFWGFGAIFCSAVVTTLLWTLPEAIGYGIGWGVPFIWGGLWTVLTFRYVQSCLIKERKAWQAEMSKV